MLRLSPWGDLPHRPRHALASARSRGRCHVRPWSWGPGQNAPSATCSPAAAARPNFPPGGPPW